jgi:uncharacterized membrane protein
MIQMLGANRMTRRHGLIHNVTPGAVSRVHIAGHAIHPMLVTFPIAFVTATLFADLAFWWTEDAFWAEAAFWSLIGAVVGGLAAAAAGMADFLLVPQIRRHVSSWSHFIAAVMVIAIAFANLLLRWEDPAIPVMPMGIYLSALNLLLLAIAGWLGGKLVFVHNLGPGNPGQFPGAKGKRQDPER